MTGTATCGTCGRSFPDIYPSARCPYEYDHDEMEEVAQMDYYGMGQIVDAAVATGHALRVELDNGEVVGAGEDLAVEWDALAPGEGFTILGWIGYDGTEHEPGEPTATVMRMTADMLRHSRGDADALARAADAFDSRAAVRETD